MQRFLGRAILRAPVGRLSLKYVCDGCERLVTPAAFELDGGVLVLRCPRCEGSSRLDGQRPATARPAGAEATSLPASPMEAELPIRPALTTSVQEAVPTEPPPRPEPITQMAPLPLEARCPKCASPRVGTSCRKCGVIFEMWKGEEDPRWDAAQDRLPGLLTEPEGGPLHLALEKTADTEELGLLTRALAHHLAEKPGDAKAVALREWLQKRSLQLAFAVQEHGRNSEAEAERLKRTVTIVGAIVTILMVAVSLWGMRGLLL